MIQIVMKKNLDLELTMIVKNHTHQDKVRIKEVDPIRQDQGSGDQTSRPYTPRTTSGEPGSSKPYTPKPSYGSQTSSKPYTPRPNGNPSGSNNGPRPKYPTNQNRFNKPNNNNIKNPVMGFFSISIF